eukprot:Platyproteum_vivax@DN5248_c0_g1_i1.p1
MYTKQQLVGGSSYNTRVKLGNWYEEKHTESHRLKQFLKSQEVVVDRQRHLHDCLRPENLSTVREDGTLQFEDEFMLGNHETDGFLSANPCELCALGTGEKALTTTTAPVYAPCSRNVVSIERANTDDGFDDNLVHFGQPIRIRLHEALGCEMYLQSELATTIASSKFTRNQRVLFHPTKNANTVWTFIHPDPTVRFDVELAGLPISTNHPLVLLHNPTGRFLASEHVEYYTDFGLEYEVHCHAHLPANKTQHCFSEVCGTATGDLSKKQTKSENLWTIIMKPRQETAMQTYGETGDRETGDRETGDVVRQ